MIHNTNPHAGPCWSRQLGYHTPSEVPFTAPYGRRRKAREESEPSNELGEPQSANTRANEPN